MTAMRKLWHFWLDEYRKIIPDWFHTPGLRLKRAPEVVIKTPDFFQQQSEAYLKKISGKRIKVILDGPLVLRRQVSIPDLNDKLTQSALRTNLQKKSLVPVKDLQWVSSLIKAGSRNTYEQVITKKQMLAEIQHTISALGGDCIEITARGSKQPFIRFKDSVSRAVKVWVFINLILLLIAIGWFGFNKLNQQAGMRIELSSLENRVSKLKAQAVEHIALKNEIQLQTESLGTALKVYEIGRGLNEQLLFLTRAFSDDTWVSEYEFIDGALFISGFTDQKVLSLLEDIKANKLVKDASLTSAVSGSSNSMSKRFSMRISFVKKSIQ